MATNKKSTAYRSAKTGRFVTEKYAKKHPKTTVRERIAKPVKKKRRASCMPFPAKPGC